MKKTTLIIIIAVVLVAVLGVAAFFVISNNNKKDQISSKNSSTVSEVTIIGGEVSAEMVEAQQNDELAVKVNIAQNPGFAGYHLKVSFDSSAITFDSCDAGLLNPIDLEDMGDGNVEIIGCENKDVTENGTLLTLKFKSNNKAGEYPVNIEVIEMANWDEQTVKPEIKAGKVVVK